MLREAAPAISESMTNLFNFSLQSGTLPVEWKSAHVIPIFKKGQKDLVKNYRPISLTSLLVKTLERLIYNRIFGFIGSNNLLSSHQYGFRPGYSCTSQLITFSMSGPKHLINASLPMWYFWTLKLRFSSSRPSSTQTRTLWHYRLFTFLANHFSPGFKAMIRPILEYACQAWNPPKHIWLKNLNACKGTLQDGPLVKTLRMKTDWNPWNYRR